MRFKNIWKCFFSLLEIVPPLLYRLKQVFQIIFLHRKCLVIRVKVENFVFLTFVFCPFHFHSRSPTLVLLTSQDWRQPESVLGLGGGQISSSPDKDLSTIEGSQDDFSSPNNNDDTFVGFFWVQPSLHRNITILLSECYFLTRYSKRALRGCHNCPS